MIQTTYLSNARYIKNEIISSRKIICCRLKYFAVILPKNKKIPQILALFQHKSIKSPFLCNRKQT